MTTTATALARFHLIDVIRYTADQQLVGLWLTRDGDVVELAMPLRYIHLGGGR